MKKSNLRALLFFSAYDFGIWTYKQVVAKKDHYNSASNHIKLSHQSIQNYIQECINPKFISKIKNQNHQERIDG